MGLGHFHNTEVQTGHRRAWVMKSQAAIPVGFEGIVGMAEINVLDSGFWPVTDAMQISEDTMDRPTPRMSDLTGQAVQAGRDRQIVKHMPHPAARLVLRPMFAALL